MILVIDNYDSFTFNLVQYLGDLGEDLKVVRNDAIGLAGIEALAPEAIVISPGPGRPENSGIIVDAIRRFSGRVPILGVCLGHQAIGAAFGGRIEAGGTLFVPASAAFEIAVEPPEMEGTLNSVFLRKSTMMWITSI